MSALYTEFKALNILLDDVEARKCLFSLRRMDDPAQLTPRDALMYMETIWDLDAFLVARKYLYTLYYYIKMRIVPNNYLQTKAAADLKLYCGILEPYEMTYWYKNECDYQENFVWDESVRPAVYAYAEEYYDYVPNDLVKYVTGEALVRIND